MDCMKCGRNIPDDQCFCESCLAGMEPYPIRVDAAVSLPHRTPYEASKKTQSHRKLVSEQEQIRRLKQRIRRLWSLIGLLLIALIITCCLTVNLVMHASRPKPGQNYTTSTTPAANTAPETKFGV